MVFYMLLVLKLGLHPGPHLAGWSFSLWLGNPLSALTVL